MARLIALRPNAEYFQSVDDADSPIDEWTLDDLDRSSDLDSIRFAWQYADEAID